MKSTQMFLVLGWLALSWVCTSCSKGDAPVKLAPEPVVAESITLVSGDGQSAMVATTLANPVAVMVKDKKGNAFKGTTVNFTTTEGSVSPATATTDTEGMATVSWTLGASAGTQKVTVMAFKTNGTTPLTGSPLAATATASTEPLVAESITLFSGDGQTAVVETLLANPIEVVVKDQNGDALGGVAVNFTVSEGAVSRISTTTEENGTATVSWTLGASVGTQTITVTAFKPDGTTPLTGSPLAVTATASSNIQVSTLAGSTAGFADGNGVDAQFNSPAGVAVDVLGNVYVADRNNHKIRKIIPGGRVSTVAGSTEGFVDGTAADAKFRKPYGVSVDLQGNIFVGGFFNQKIRKITPEGVVSTLAGSIRGFADGSGVEAQFTSPIGTAVDEEGNVYVGDFGNHKIRKITVGGMVSTLAGSNQGFADGTGSDAQFAFPTGVALDVQGNFYVADRNNHKIRKITPVGTVSTVAGSTQGFADGTGTDAQFDNPFGVAVDAFGNVYVADTGNHKIRKITPEGMVSTLAGSNPGFTDGTGADAQLSSPIGVALDVQGNIYVADTSNHKIRKITQ